MYAKGMSCAYYQENLLHENTIYFTFDHDFAVKTSCIHTFITDTYKDRQKTDKPSHRARDGQLIGKATARQVDGHTIRQTGRDGLLIGQT